jgi:hypothetical protein
MSTSDTITAIHFLPDGTDSFGSPVDGNVVIGIHIEITDLADVPLGGPVELGTWTEGLWIEDPGGRRVRTLGGDDGPLDLDPPIIDDQDDDDPADLFHLDVQYTEPAGPELAAA